MSKLMLCVDILVRMISCREDDPQWGGNALKHLMHVHDNLEGIGGVSHESLKMISLISNQARCVSWR